MTIKNVKVEELNRGPHLTIMSMVENISRDIHLEDVNPHRAPITIHFINDFDYIYTGQGLTFHSRDDTEICPSGDDNK